MQAPGLQGNGGVVFHRTDNGDISQNALNIISDATISVTISLEGARRWPCPGRGTLLVSPPADDIAVPLSVVDLKFPGNREGGPAQQSLKAAEGKEVLALLPQRVIAGTKSHRHLEFQTLAQGSADEERFPGTMTQVLRNGSHGLLFTSSSDI